MEPPVQTPNDLRQSRIVMKQDSTLIAVIEMSLSSWLVAGIAPGAERQPLKKLAVDANALVKLLNRWREEAEKGRKIERVAVAFEAGRDGFWLARRQPRLPPAFAKVRNLGCRFVCADFGFGGTSRTAGI
jgi:hypothetical protein